MSEFEVKILQDSVNANGKRLTTFQLKYPFIIHAEVMTHRVFTRSYSSARSVPAKKKLAENPYIPLENFVYKNTKGMQGKELIDADSYDEFFNDTISLFNIIKMYTEKHIDIHKQHINRYLQPFGYMYGIITATDYANFFILRNSNKAQPELEFLANMMEKAYNASSPKILNVGEWHIPFILQEEEDLTLHVKLKVSAARCARISYQNHGTDKVDIIKDIDLTDQLLRDFHMSPFEHMAMSSNQDKYYSNFDGFISYRKFIEEGQNLDSELIYDLWINGEKC